MVKKFLIAITFLLFGTNILVGYEFKPEIATLNVSSYEELIRVPRIIRCKVIAVTGIDAPAQNDEEKWGPIFDLYFGINKVGNDDVPWKNNTCFPAGIGYRRFAFALDVFTDGFDWADIPEYIKKDCKRLFTNNGGIFKGIYTHLPCLKRIYFYGTKLPATTTGQNIFGGTAAEPTDKLIKFQAPNVEYKASAFIECPNLTMMQFKESSGIATTMIIDDLTNLPTEKNENITKVIITDATTTLIPDHITALKALYENLEDIEITEYAGIIANQLFYNANATWLKSFSADKVTEIGVSAFYNCTSLTDIYLPEAVVINASAFYDCTSLKDIYLPKANSIGTYVFYNCTLLENLYLCSNGSFTGSSTTNVSDILNTMPATVINMNLYLGSGASIGTTSWQGITFKSISECP